MACPQNTMQIPINIKSDKRTQYVRNLSKFTYDFINATKLTIANISTGVKGLGYIQLDGITNSHINISTMGKLRLMNILFYINSLNKYNNQRKDMELMLIFMDNSNDILIMFIPLTKRNDNSSSTQFFKEFVPLLKEKEANDDNYTDVVTVNTLNVNNIIPRSSFMYYNSAVCPLFGNCNLKMNMIFYDTISYINESDYNKLVSIFGEFSKNELTTETTDPILHLNNYETMYSINDRMMYFNKQGTKNGPGKHGDNVLPLTCTPILDEEDKPIEGSRLDWISQDFSKISPAFKNFLFIFLLILVVIGVMVTIHEFAFKFIGRLIGDEKILYRSESKL